MATDDKNTSERQWHLDKKVPIALIFSIFVQSGVFIWWASGLNERVNGLERASAVTTIAAPVQADRLTRVESKMESVQRDVTEIKADIKSLVRRDPTIVR